MYNVNSGFGQVIGQLPFLGSGKHFVVGDSSTVNEDMLKELFGYDPDGTLRFFDDIDEANNHCTANAGDMILVMPSHAESLTAAGAIALDTAGVSVRGLGVGNNRPVITFASTDNAATMTMSGNNTRLENVVLVCNDDGLTNGLVVSGNNCYIDIETQDTSSAVEFATAVRLDTADNCILKLKHIGFTAGNAMVSAVRLDDCDNVRIDIDGFGVLTTAWVEMVDVASTNVYVTGRVFTQGVTGGTRDIVDTITGSTWYGEIEDMSAGRKYSGGSAQAWASDDVSGLAAAIDAIDNFVDTEVASILTASGAVADAALADTIEGAAASTQSMITDIKGVLQRLGADNANNTAATTLVVANTDGSILERLEAIQQHVGATDGATNILGANDADNGFDSSAVVANADGSVVERLEDIVVKVTAVDDIIDTEFPVIVTAVGAVADAVLADTIEGTDATTQSILTDVKGVLQRIGADSANNSAATTLVDANDDGSLLERVEGLKDALVLVRGTFTTSSATVPADTGRTEANDYWNGCYLIPTAGAIIGEPRQIVDFANAGGVFTLDADIPFTAVPGTVAYVIVPGPGFIAAAADSTAVTTPAHTIGNKADAAATGAVSATESLMAYAKQVVTNTEAAATSLTTIDANQDVGVADAATNALMRDVVGNKTDAANTSIGATLSLVANLKGILSIVAGLDVTKNSKLGLKVTKAASDVINGTADVALFTVSGGRVLLTHFEMELTAADIAAGVCNVNIQSDPTVGGDLDLCAILDVDGDTNGSLYSITGVLADALQGGVPGGTVGMSRGIIIPEGNIALTSSSDGGSGGSQPKFEMWYIPLDTGATVVAA